MGQNKNKWVYIGRSGLDHTSNFQKFCGSGRDRIQFYRIRTWLGMKSFTIRSSRAYICLYSDHILSSDARYKPALMYVMPSKLRNLTTVGLPDHGPERNAEKSPKRSRQRTQTREAPTDIQRSFKQHYEQNILTKT